MTRAAVECVPLTLPIANRAVTEWHRHHAPIPAGFPWWSVGAVVNGVLVGAAIAGRPTNRNNDDGVTVEVLRLATDGTPNACSALLGACARAAKAIGARRCVTYTLTEESGASIRGAGWCLEREGIKSYWTKPGYGRAAIDRPHMAKTKTRWAIHFTDRPSFTIPWTDPVSAQEVLAL